MNEIPNRDGLSSGAVLIQGDGVVRIVAIVGTIIWNLVSWPLAWLFLIHMHSPFFVYILMPLFPLIGLMLIVSTFYTIRAHRRLGDPVLALTQPGLVGHVPLQGQIQFIPPLGMRLDQLEMTHEVKVSLVCLRVDNRFEDTVTSTLWEGAAVQSHLPRGTTNLNFKIDLPKVLPAEISPSSKSIREYWQVVLETLGATVKYEVPVLTSTMARSEELQARLPGSLEGMNAEKVKKYKRARWVVQGLVYVLLAVMVWRISGEFIGPLYQLVEQYFRAPHQATSASRSESSRYPHIYAPIKLDSLSGNGFGVVSKVAGKLEIDDDTVYISPDSIELRSIFNCDPDCPLIHSVRFSLTKDEGGYFSILAAGSPIPVQNKLPDTDSLHVKVNEDQKQVLLKFASRRDLADMRLTLEIDGELKNKDEIHQASWYTHADTFRGVLGEVPLALQIPENPDDRLKQARKAVFDDRVADLQQLLDAGVDVNALDAQGETMLMNAAYRRSVNSVKLLLAHGAEVNAATPVDKDGIGGSTPLHIAVRQDAVDVVDALLSAGANTDAAANQIWTPTHYAASVGSVKSMRYLHSKNISIDQPFKGARGSTPLMVAAQFDQVEMIKNLLNIGADPFRKDLYGENACGYAKFFKKPASIAALGCK
jgi:ankyrin repeat protein